MEFHISKPANSDTWGFSGNVYTPYTETHLQLVTGYGTSPIASRYPLAILRQSNWDVEFRLYGDLATKAHKLTAERTYSLDSLLLEVIFTLSPTEIVDLLRHVCSYSFIQGKCQGEETVKSALRNLIGV